MREITFSCDLSEKTTPLTHFWEHTVGSGHATLALRVDWQQQLLRAHKELGFGRVRFHGLLHDDMSTRLEEEGKPLYSFSNIDRIFDFLQSIGMAPFVELSFMPTALASGKKTVFHYGGNVTPPKDHSKWASLIAKLAEHWKDRYGAREVRNWFFEVWNEPNLKAFWNSSQAEYFKLYRHTAEAIKDVDSAFRVGGPATAKNEWIDEFVDFTEKCGVPADFISTHHYPTDALGSATDNTEEQLARSQRGILREQAQDTFRRARGKPVYYTEWNVSSNPRDPLHDEPFAAAFAAKTILEANGLVQGYSFWTFSDIFEENYFPSVPFQGGFGLLNIQGIAKPVYRAFQLLHELGTEQLVVDGMHATVNAWAVRKGRSVTILLTNHVLPFHLMETKHVAITLRRAQRPRSAYVRRIDETHANPKRLWQTMGAPEYPSGHQVEKLQDASELKKETLSWHYENGAVHFSLYLPPQAIAAITMELESER